MDPHEQQIRFNEVHNCGKLKVLAALLDALNKNKSKVLLFSYSVKLLDLLQTFVIEQKYSFSRLDGHTKTSHRLALVDEFNHNPDIFLFLISTKWAQMFRRLSAL